MQQLYNPSEQELLNYLSGDISLEKSAKIEQWLHESEVNQSQFHEILLQYVAKASDQPKVSTPKKPKRINWLYGLAASIVVFLIAAILYTNNTDINAEQVVYLPDSTKVTLYNDSEVFYDSSYLKTGLVSLKGIALIDQTGVENAVMTVKIHNGYYLFENAQALIESHKDISSSCDLYLGKADYINFNKLYQSYSLSAGKAISIKPKKNIIIIADAKTITI